jgi:hypothetical protein
LAATTDQRRLKSTDQSHGAGIVRKPLHWREKRNTDDEIFFIRASGKRRCGNAKRLLVNETVRRLGWNCMIEILTPNDFPRFYFPCDVQDQRLFCYE